MRVPHHLRLFVKQTRGTITGCRDLVSSGNGHLWNAEINPHIVRASYAVRGLIPDAADDLQSILQRVR